MNIQWRFCDGSVDDDSGDDNGDDHGKDDLPLNIFHPKVIREKEEKCHDGDDDGHKLIIE